MVKSYARRFVESLEGLRAVAALGVLTTHVAFQTGVDPASHFGALTARFDFFVAVFFALSAFLLWRRHRTDRRWGSYYFRRAARIAPAYLACALAVLLLLPEAFGVGALAAVAQLTLTQIYVPDALIPGLTHMWSLCVEVAFYLGLPPLALVVSRWRRARTRVAVIVVVAGASSVWPWLPFVAGQGGEASVNLQIWPPSYAMWFAVGLVAAEVEAACPRLPRWVVTVARQRWLFWLMALVVAWVAGREWFGPLGLTHPSPGEFTARIGAGAVFAALIVWPYALLPKDGDLIASGPVRLLGRWSYSIFLWHLAVLSVTLPLTGIRPFTGNFLVVLGLTALGSIAVAGCSYVLIERPAAQALTGWWHRRHGAGDYPGEHRPGQKRAVASVEGLRRPGGAR